MTDQSNILAIVLARTQFGPSLVHNSSETDVLGMKLELLIILSFIKSFRHTDLTT